jgi:hypothetical protein
MQRCLEFARLFGSSSSTADLAAYTAICRTQIDLSRSMSATPCSVIRGLLTR